MWVCGAFSLTGWEMAAWKWYQLRAAVATTFGCLFPVVCVAHTQVSLSNKDGPSFPVNQASHTCLYANHHYSFNIPLSLFGLVLFLQQSVIFAVVAAVFNFVCAHMEVRGQFK